MSACSDEEFERLLVEGESDLAERKESLKGDAPAAVGEAVCSFANDWPDHKPASVAFVGVKDDGSPSGLAVTDELLRSLADIKTDGNSVPPLTLTAGKRTLRGSEVAVVSVEPSDSTPVRYTGRIHIRIGPRRGTASARDERILSEKRRHRDRPFDVQPMPSAQ